jgi:hypothetical protein
MLRDFFLNFTVIDMSSWSVTGTGPARLCGSGFAKRSEHMCTHARSDQSPGPSLATAAFVSSWRTFAIWRGIWRRALNQTVAQSVWNAGQLDHVSIVECVQIQEFSLGMRRPVVHDQKDRWHWIVHDISKVLTIWDENFADVGGQREAILTTFRRSLENKTARHQRRIGILDSELVRYQMKRFQWLPEPIHRRHQAHLIEFDLIPESCLSYRCLNKRSAFAWLSLGAN